MATVTPLVETRNLTCHFDGLKAIDSVDFKLEKGEIRALIGPNGAGKTTLVNLICGRTRPDSGKIFFEGRDITGLPAHKRVLAGIAYTFQITSIFPDLSVYDNVLLPVQRRLMADRHFSNRALDASVTETLERVGLSNYANVSGNNLSYGHQRLLELAMGLALQPKLLILDEPTQGLSDGEIDNFIALVRAIAESTSILLIEHNVQVVMQLASRITVLNFGRILAEGNADEIRADTAVQEAYLGTGHD